MLTLMVKMEMRIILVKTLARPSVPTIAFTSDYKIQLSGSTSSNDIIALTIIVLLRVINLILLIVELFMLMQKI